MPEYVPAPVPDRSFPPTLPYSREQGFGDLGVQVLVVEVDGQRTAYVPIDGNNMAEGVRDTLLAGI